MITKPKDVTRGTYGDVLRRRAAALNTLNFNETPSGDYLAVRNAKRLVQFRSRWNNGGVNIVRFHGKIETLGERPDLYLA